MKQNFSLLIADFDYFDPAEAEFKSIRDLFVHIEKRTGETPVVVNATDLLENPGNVTFHIYFSILFIIARQVIGR